MPGPDAGVRDAGTTTVTVYLKNDTTHERRPFTGTQEEVAKQIRRFQELQALHPGGGNWITEGAGDEAGAAARGGTLRPRTPVKLAPLAPLAGAPDAGAPDAGVFDAGGKKGRGKPRDAGALVDAAKRVRRVVGRGSPGATFDAPPPKEDWPEPDYSPNPNRPYITPEAMAEWERQGQPDMRTPEQRARTEVLAPTDENVRAARSERVPSRVPESIAAPSLLDGRDAGTPKVMRPYEPPPRPRDAGVDRGPRDAGYDAGFDAGYDAGRDAGYDAGRPRDGGRMGWFDAGPDAGDAGSSLLGSPMSRAPERDAGAPPASRAPEAPITVTLTVVGPNGALYDVHGGSQEQAKKRADDLRATLRAGLPSPIPPRTKEKPDAGSKVRTEPGGFQPFVEPTNEVQPPQPKTAEPWAEVVDQASGDKLSLRGKTRAEMIAEYLDFRDKHPGASYTRRGDVSFLKQLEQARMRDEAMREEDKARARQKAIDRRRKLADDELDIPMSPAEARAARRKHIGETVAPPVVDEGEAAAVRVSERREPTPGFSHWAVARRSDGTEVRLGGNSPDDVKASFDQLTKDEGNVILVDSDRESRQRIKPPTTRAMDAGEAPKGGYASPVLGMDSQVPAEPTTDLGRKITRAKGVVRGTNTQTANERDASKIISDYGKGMDSGAAPKPAAPSGVAPSGTGTWGSPNTVRPDQGGLAGAARDARGADAGTEPRPMTTEEAAAEARRRLDEDAAKDNPPVQTQPAGGYRQTPPIDTEPAPEIDTSPIQPPDLSNTTPEKIEKDTLEKEGKAAGSRAREGEIVSKGAAAEAEKYGEAEGMRAEQERRGRQVVDEGRSSLGDIQERMRMLSDRIAENEAKPQKAPFMHTFFNLLGAAMAFRYPDRAAGGRMLQQAVPIVANKIAHEIAADKNEYNRLAQMFGMQSNETMDQLQQEAMITAAAWGKIQAGLARMQAETKSKALAQQLGTLRLEAEMAMGVHGADLLRRQQEQYYATKSIEELSGLLARGELPAIGQAVLERMRKAAYESSKQQGDLELMDAEKTLKLAQAAEAETRAKYGPQPSEGQLKYDILVRGGQLAYERVAKRLMDGTLKFPATAMSWGSAMSKLNKEEEQLYNDLGLLVDLVIRGESGANMPPEETDTRAQKLGLRSLDENIRKEGVRQLLKHYEGMDRMQTLKKVDWSKQSPTRMEQIAIDNLQKADNQRLKSGTASGLGRGAKPPPAAQPTTAEQELAAEKEFAAQEKAARDAFFQKWAQNPSGYQIRVYSPVNEPLVYEGRALYDALTRRNFTLIQKPQILVEYYRRINEARRKQGK